MGRIQPAGHSLPTPWFRLWSTLCEQLLWSNFQRELFFVRVLHNAKHWYPSHYRLLSYSFFKALNCNNPSTHWNTIFCPHVNKGPSLTGAQVRGLIRRRAELQCENNADLVVAVGHNPTDLRECRLLNIYIHSDAAHFPKTNRLTSHQGNTN